jgi:pre-mRNA-splicing factor 38A
MRLTGRPVDVYQYLEPLLNDYRKLASRSVAGWALSHMDEFVHELLTGDSCCDVALPHLTKRSTLEGTGQLPPRVSMLTALQEAEEEDSGEGSAAGEGGAASGDDKDGDGGGRQPTERASAISTTVAAPTVLPARAGSTALRARAQVIGAPVATDGRQPGPTGSTGPGREGAALGVPGPRRSDMPATKTDPDRDRRARSRSRSRSRSGQRRRDATGRSRSRSRGRDDADFHRRRDDYGRRRPDADRRHGSSERRHRSSERRPRSRSRSASRSRERYAARDDDRHRVRRDSPRARSRDSDRRRNTGGRRGWDRSRSRSRDRGGRYWDDDSRRNGHRSRSGSESRNRQAGDAREEASARLPAAPAGSVGAGGGGRLFIRGLKVPAVAASQVLPPPLQAETVLHKEKPPQPGVGAGRAGPAAATGGPSAGRGTVAEGSVEWWNQERAKLGLKPLKS